jgi:competence protein ComEC
MLSRAPFVGVVLCYIFGVLTGDWLFSSFSISPRLFLIAAVCCLLVCFSLYFLKKKVAFGIGFSLFLFCLGGFAQVRQEEAKDDEIRFLKGHKYTHYQAIVVSLPEKRRKSFRLEVVVNRILSAEKQWVDTRCKALIYIDTRLDQVPRPGEMIISKGLLELPTDATNPGQFDYRRYLRNKGILWTDYIRKTDFHILGQLKAASNAALLGTKVSERADRIFQQNITNDSSYGLVKAMLLGRRDDLGEEQVAHYVASGAVHILSVSGMHVAIIFLIISYALGWIKQIRFGAGLFLCLVSILLGFYALVTGLAPSVQRATIMCIVFAIAQCYGRKNSSMNTLAISALLILLPDPAAVYDVGFQLSYLAMTGIFLLYEPICSIFDPSNRGIRFVWQITALSLAAQLATFPLSLYYFHQFPTYFWLVNPFVIAFTNILLPAAMLLLVVSVFNVSVLNLMVGFIVDWSARLTDMAVTWPEQLPGYLIRDLHLGTLEVILLYTILVLVWYACQSQNYDVLKYSFAVVLLFASLSISASIGIYLAARQTVHIIPGHSVQSYKEGNVLYVVSDKSFVTDTSAYDFYLQNYAVESEIGRVVPLVSR